MMRKISFFLLFFTMCNLKTWSQNPYNQVSIASPNAASMAKFAEIPVNKNSGVPSINLPITNISDGTINVPVTLSYHASGIKLEEVSSWVGTGWSLNAGGVITRTIVGTPDEKGTNAVDQHTHGYFSDYGYQSYLWEVGGGNPAPGVNDSIMRWDLFYNGTKDGEPDIFFFNFMGYSGKFYFRDDRKVILLERQDIKIEPVYPGTGSITSFKVTTPDGTKYFFGKTEEIGDVDPIEKTKTFSGSNNLTAGNAISSWYLNKIVSVNEDFSVKFEYDSEKYGYFITSKFTTKLNQSNNTPGSVTSSNISTFTITSSITVGGITLYNVPVGSFDVSTSSASTQFPLSGVNQFREYSLTKNLIEGVRLKKIITNNGTIEFVPGEVRQDLIAGNIYNLNDAANMEAKTLGSIKVSNVNNSSCLTYDFNYGYFEDLVTPLKGDYSGYNIQSDQKRLKLLGLQMKDCNNQASGVPHIFEYFNEIPTRRLAFAQDHWGFQNGEVNNNQLIPSYTINKFIDVPGANRDSKWPAMRAGTLKKINLPTGGSTEFEFEPNQIWVSTPKYTPVLMQNMAMGYDGGFMPVEQIVTLTGNPYKFVLKNGVCPQYTNSCMASLTIRDLNGTQYQEIESVLADVGQTTTKIIELPPGTYKFTLFKDKGNATGNVGCELKAYEMVQSTYSRHEMVGGLRVKEIKHIDKNNTNAKTIRYDYNVNEIASSKLYSRPNYVQVVRNDVVRDVGEYNVLPLENPPCGNPNISNNPVVSIMLFVQNPGTVRQLDNVQGYHIGYNEVKEAETNNGFRIYRFYGSNSWDSNINDVAIRNVNINPPCNPSVPNFPSAPYDFEPVRGKIKYEGYFNQQGKILKEKYFEHVYNEEQMTTPGFISTNVIGKALSTFYEIKSFKKMSEKIIEFDYSSNLDAQKNEYYVEYESEFHNQPTLERLFDSKGKVLDKKYRYVYDVTVPACNNLENGNSEYFSTLSLLLNNFYTQINVPCGSLNCRWICWQQLMHKKSLARRKWIAVNRINFTDVNNQYNILFENSKSLADVSLKPILEMKWRSQNALLETSSFKDGLLTKANFFQFSFRSGIGNKIDLRDGFKINSFNLLSDFVPSVMINNSNVKDSRYKKEFSLLYDKGNLVEEAKVVDVKKTYIYGYNNQYPVAQIIGADYNNCIAFVNEAVLNNPLTNDAQMRTELNKIRTGLANTKAQVITMTYEPLIGMTSQTDPNGRTNFYEYDGFNRLTTIKNQEGNIVKKFCYKYDGQPEDCGLHYSVAMSQYFVRNNCAANETGSAVLFTVPAGMFTAASAAEADQLALNYLQANGQNYANTNGTCTPVPSCDWSNCNSQGEGYACINGACEFGAQIFTNSYYDSNLGSYMCEYHYEYSDGSWSQTYTISTGGAICAMGF